jgi:hypothetical protein
MTIDDYVIELHGSLHSGLSSRIDRNIDDIQSHLFCEGSVRSWQNDETLIFLPSVRNDVLLIFAHILQHFFRGGIGLRQVCDWCRLMWKYHKEVDARLLEKRLYKMGLMTEWRTFAALAVEMLGMPVETMPLYSPQKKWSRKAWKTLLFIMETGNFGNNRDYSYYEKFPYAVYKLISFFRHVHDLLRYFPIFPKDSFIVFTGVIKGGFKALKKDI